MLTENLVFTFPKCDETFRDCWKVKIRENKLRQLNFFLFLEENTGPYTYYVTEGEGGQIELELQAVTKA